MLPGSYGKLSREMSLQKWLGAKKGVTSACVEYSVCPVTESKSQSTFKRPGENIRCREREKGREVKRTQQGNNSERIFGDSFMPLQPAFTFTYSERHHSTVKKDKTSSKTKSPQQKLLTYCTAGFI